ncbi:hypothetical protein [Streptomyces sp. NPDC101237]|uniref:hypothetical protein n=1 Tax=Streptomyces sp. NPDC101237 TaxID=3366139 RepID=UPI003804884D
MASDVHIPVSELEEARKMLDTVHGEIDIGHSLFDFDRAFGPELSRGAAQNFEDRWEDGKHQLQKQVEGIQSAIGDILDSMARTDQDAVAHLGGGK